MRKKLTRNSLSITRKSDTGITRLNLNVLASSGIRRAGGITTLDQKTQAGEGDPLLLELLNCSQKLAEIQQRKSLEDLDTLASIADTKAALVALYNSIGYTTGIEELNK